MERSKKRLRISMEMKKRSGYLDTKGREGGKE